MRIQIQNGLPIVTMSLKHHQKSIHLTNVLFDTGCAATVFDTDLLSRIGIRIDFMNGKAKRMYGIGGTSEICYEQIIPNLKNDTIQFTSFPIQLGSIQEPYGFDGILGIDFMLRAKLKADFESLQIFYSS